MKTIKYIFAAVLLLTINAVHAQAQKPIDKVLGSYLALKNALADDDSKLANQKAKDLTAALKEVNINDLDATQKQTWSTYSEKLRFDGEHIGHSQSIEHQREHFASLSKNMYSVIKAFKTNSAVVYMQYCPMKKESWLSESQAIKNPYYGKSMSDCGKVTETLKGASK